MNDIAPRQKIVLVVDGNRDLLHALKEGLGRSSLYALITAEDDLEAMAKLNQHHVALVVAELGMPHMDGSTLLSHVMEHYPDIPMVIITGYSIASMPQIVREGGVAGFLEKPFKIEALDKVIRDVLKKQSEGGVLYAVSAGAFLQMMEMEQSTATVRLADQASGRQGVLFFKQGDLLDARVGSLQGVEAAYVILGWDKVTLFFEKRCPMEENKIHSDLQALLLEAMRRKDEAERAGIVAPVVEEEVEVERPSKEATSSEASFVDRIRAELEKAIANEEKPPVLAPKVDVSADFSYTKSEKISADSFPLDP